MSFISSSSLNSSKLWVIFFKSVSTSGRGDGISLPVRCRASWPAAVVLSSDSFCKFTYNMPDVFGCCLWVISWVRV